MAIEINPGDVELQVKMLCGHMVNAQEFGQDTFPTDDDIDRNIEDTQAEILVWLASFGFSTNILTWTTTAINFLSWYNALGAAYRVEMAHTGLVFSATPSTRAESYYTLYMRLYDQLVSGNLDLGAVGVPASLVGHAQAAITGTKRSEKLVLEENPDAVLPAFSKRLFRDPVARRNLTGQDTTELN